MLIRLITVISLILFLLLMLSGAEVNVAIYRSMMAFVSLFSVIYLTIFLLNVVKDNKSDNMQMSDSGGGSSKTPGDS